MIYGEGFCLLYIIKMLAIMRPVLMKATQLHSERATLFSHFSHSIVGPEHRGVS